jgi:hypothetical protein
MKHFLLLRLIVDAPFVPVIHAYATPNSSITVRLTMAGESEALG